MSILGLLGIPPGISDALIWAGKWTSLLTLGGGFVAWLFTRLDQRRARKALAASQSEQQIAARAAADHEREQEERQYFGERARSEIGRLERERDVYFAKWERAMADERRAREGWIACLGAARQLQQLVVSMCRMPPEKGTAAPVFEILPDPYAPNPVDVIGPVVG